MPNLNALNPGEKGRGRSQLSRPRCTLILSTANGSGSTSAVSGMKTQGAYTCIAKNEVGVDEDISSSSLKTQLEDP